MEPKTERIKFWLDDKELAFLDRKAKEAGVSRSAYIRELMNETDMIAAADIDYASYTEEFRRLGKHLNARLKRMNSTGEIDHTEIETIISGIKKTVERLLNDMRAATPSLRRKQK